MKLLIAFLEFPLPWNKVREWRWVRTVSGHFPKFVFGLYIVGLVIAWAIWLCFLALYGTYFYYAPYGL